MKLLTLGIMFCLSSLTGIYYGHILKEREYVLKELSAFLKYLLIKVSAKSGTLWDFTYEYKESPHIKGFLKELAQRLKWGCPCPFEASIQKLYALNEQDKRWICSVKMGRLDYEGQIKALEGAICYFEEEIKALSGKEKERHIISYSGILAGLALVVIFI
ncbi:MAG: stage III sporulation protein AB [Clostridia bacterium]|nr:stage III sporulation protein AB [Clostridia bacterium]